MYTAHPVHTHRTLATVAPPKVVKPQAERRFCPSMFCLTDEITVRCISPKTEVWLLTDEREENTWLSMGSEPVCPHCGTALL